MPKKLYLISIFVLFLTVSAKAGTLIDNVQTDSPTTKAFATEDEINKDYSISWQLTMPGVVTALISDLEGNIVSTFIDKQEFAAGDHILSWDGLDDSGDKVPVGLYIPIIKVKTKTRGVETYNPTSLPWGEEIIPETISYDSGSEIINYTLAKGAFCRLRVGEKDGGPLYKTVANWKYSPAGSHEEPWDGMDISGIIKAADQPKFRIALDAFSLPDATILITDGPLLRDQKKTYAKAPIFPPHGKRVAFYPSLPNGLLPDLFISTTFHKADAQKDGSYKVHGNTSIAIDLTGGTLGSTSEENIEVLLYVDGEMIREDKIKKFPAILKFDTTQFSKGNHVVTINLRTSGDRAASSSIKIIVNN